VANVTVIPTGISGLKELREERGEVLKKKESALKEFEKEGTSMYCRREEGGGAGQVANVTTDWHQWPQGIEGGAWGGTQD
jgi:hypothetical protein